MSELTVREHNEQLILERAYLEQEYRTIVAQASRVIAALLADEDEPRLITAQEWVRASEKEIVFQPQEDGSALVSIHDMDEDTEAA